MPFRKLKYGSISTEYMFYSNNTELPEEGITCLIIQNKLSENSFHKLNKNLSCE